jgi:transposase
VVALSIVSAIGDFSGFAMRDKLTSYLGLNPKVRQSGEGMGRLTEAGRSHARAMIGEAARSAIGRHATGVRALMRRSPRARGPASVGSSCTPRANGS